ncbi:ABC transporter ATP-binding protein [Puteibacter caeruleilacunae]|nr:ABC transporter ATP-binding protein [Puteibacter caeruleilacunae]
MVGQRLKRELKKEESRNMIEAKDVSLSFGEQELFKDLNFQIPKGTNVVFGGPSGRGKSSLLKIIQGYIRPDKGKILVNGRELNEETIAKIRGDIAWIPQNINLPVDKGSELMKLMEVSSRQKIAEEYLVQLGLKPEFLDKDFREISGGQKQRIIIAICIALDKEIILLDEPTSSLDEESIALLIDTMKSLNEKTIVSASHNQTWLNSVDQIIEL